MCGTDVTTDPTFDSNATAGAESYAKQVNDAHTFFFYPLTAGGTASVAYDLKNPNSYTYQLNVPSFYDVSSILSNSASITFDTVSSDIPGKISSAPSVGTVGSTSVSLTWTGVGDATSYKVYYLLIHTGVLKTTLLAILQGQVIMLPVLARRQRIISGLRRLTRAARRGIRLKLQPLRLHK